MTDNLSGVAGLAVSVDGGTATPVTYDANGNFSVPVTLATDGTADGQHTLTFVAVDAAGNVTSPLDFTFDLETQAPVITLDPTGVQDGGTLAAGAALVGAAAPETGDTITSLTYAFDGGATTPIQYDATTGAFDQTLDLSSLATGSHTLTITAMDAAGNQTVQTLNVTLPAQPDLTIASLTPMTGANDVGVTYRPQIMFSRAVDPSTLTSADFYATDASGDVVPATIVPISGGMGAYLLFTNPLPGASTITLNVNGADILGQADGAELDAAGTGTPGSVYTETFTTVSTTPVPNTTISGIVVDPGPDNTPFTPDDVKNAPDGVTDYANDKWKLPIAGVKVYILGDEQDAVYTNAQGQFTLTSVPTGDVKVVFDGTTATNDPSGFYFPTMTMDLTDVQAGVNNTVAGTMGTTAEQQATANDPAVYLPRVANDVLQPVSDAQPTTITAPADAYSSSGSFNLTAAQMSELSLTIQPNSIVDAGGNPLINPTVGISPVPPSIVQDMLPPGVMQHTFDITIQAPGGAVFTQPAQITAPNVFGLSPGEKTFILSFDHTTGKLVIDGTATVSSDGKTITSDPGSGVTAPGWHGFTPAGDEENTHVIPPPTPPQETNPSGTVTYELDLTISGSWTPFKADANISINVPSIPGVNKDIPLYSSTFGGGDPSSLLSYAGGASADVNSKSLNADANVTIPASPITLDETFPFEITLPDSLAYFISSQTSPEEIFTATGTLGVKGEADAKVSYSINPSVGSSLYFAGTIGISANSYESLSLDFPALDSIPYFGKYIKNALASLSDKLNFSQPLAGLPTLSFKNSISIPSSLVPSQTLSNTIGGSATISAQTSATLTVSEQLTEIGSSDTSDTPDTLDSSEAAQELSFTALASNSPSSALPASTISTSASSDDYSSSQTTDYSVDEIPGFSTLTSISSDDRIYYRYVLADGTQLSGVSDSNGDISEFLPANSDYTLYLYQLSTNGSAIYDGTTSASGSTGNVQVQLNQVGGVDSNGDGIPDIGKFVLGIDPSKPDGSIVAGMTDLAAVQAGIFDSNNSHAFTGVESSINLDGQSTAIVLQGSTLNPSENLAYVATGSYGLAIIDVSNIGAPEILSQVELPGDATDISVDAHLQLAAVATGSGGLDIVNVDDTSNPTLEESVPINATAVQVFEGIAYANNGNQLDAIDLATGNLLQTLNLGGGTITGLARDGSMIYVMDANDRLTAIDTSSGVMVQDGSITLTQGGGRITVAGGVAYVPTDDVFSGGYSTVDVSDPNDPTLIQTPQDSGIESAAIALNGSGLAVAVGQDGGGGAGVVGLDVIDTSDPTDTGAFQTRYTLPLQPQESAAEPFDVAIGDGIAFVANASNGLEVVNYEPFDTQGVPPTITITQEPTDADPDTPGIQVVEGSTITLGAAITDDVQVRNVSVLVNGEVVSNSVSYPWDLTAQMPSIAANGSNTVTVQIQATDTGGNVTTTSPITLDLVRDTTPPVLLSQNLVNGSTHAMSFRGYTLTFSKPLDPTTVTDANFTLVGPNGTDLTPVSIELRGGDRTVQVTYPVLAAGDYVFDLNEAGITDMVGNALGTSVVATDFTIDDYTTEWLGGSDVWTNANGWSAGLVPAANDVVEVDLTAGQTLTFNSGDTQIALLDVAGAGTLALTGGVLAVSGEATIEGNLALDSAGTLQGATVRLNGGAVSFQGGVLDGVTYQGTLDLTPNYSSVTIADGLTAEGAGGVGAGTIDLGGYGSSITFQDTQTIDDATINLEGGYNALSETVSYASYVAAGYQDTTQTLTLGANLIINQSNSEYYYDGATMGGGGDGQAAIVNDGTINAEGGDFTIDPDSFTNNGAIAVTNDDSLSLSGSNVVNAAGGTITVAAGASLVFGSPSDLASADAAVSPAVVIGGGGGGSGGATNAGTINADGANLTFYIGGADWNTGILAITNSTIALYGDLDAAELASFEGAGNTITLHGDLNNTGETLTVGADDALAQVALASDGTITGGTIEDSGSGVAFQGGTLDGVAYEGTLDLTPQSSSVTVVDGLTATASDGVSPGAINMGDYASLNFQDTQTIDNATITLGGYDDRITETVSYAAYMAAEYQYTTQTLTFGANIVIDQSDNGYYYYYGGGYIGNGGGYGYGAIINDGTINAEGGYLTIDPTDFTNNGAINVSSGDTLTIDGAGVSNAAGGIITLDAGATLVFGDGNASDAATNAGTITADGATLTFYLNSPDWNTGTLAITNSTINLNGDFTAAMLAPFEGAGDTINIDGVLDNSGATLDVGAGQTVTQVTLANGGTISGGTIEDGGSGVMFQGGTLDGVTYEGTLDLTPQSSSVTIVDGLAAIASDGVSPGAINLGDYASLTFQDTQTIDDATITLGGYYDRINESVSYAAYVAAGYQYATQTLTLGPDLTIDQNDSGNYYYYYYYQDYLSGGGDGYGAIVNDGTINAQGGYFTIDPTDFTNNGEINVSGGDTLAIDGADVSNAAGGTIMLGAGATLVFGDSNPSDIATNAGTITADGATLTFYLNSANWNTGTLAITNSTVKLYGQFTAAMVTPFEGQGDTIDIYGTLDNTGGTLAVGSGNALSQVTLEGGATITDGVIQDAGSGVVFAGGTLDGVTYQGTMDLTPNGSSVTIVNGLTATASDGVGSGAINLGYDSQLYFQDTQTFDNATVTLGGDYDTLGEEVSYAAYYAAGYQYTTQTLTLGANLVLDQTGSQDYLNSGGPGYGDIVNEGTINAEGGQFYIQPTSFTNEGTIDVSGGDTLYIEPGSFTNDGSITDEAGSTIYLEGAWTNTGTITVQSAAALYLQGNFTAMALADISDQGGTVYIDGTLDNTGGTLSVGPGTANSQVVLDGSIDGGVVQDSGSGMLFQGGTLDGVTYQGTLDLTPQSSSATIVGGLTATAADGVSPGAINLGDYSVIAFQDTQTFDDATITLGGYDSQITENVSYAAYYAAGYQYTTQTLTLGPNLTINQTGDQDYLSSGGPGYGDIVDQGTINAEGGVFYIIPTSFTNEGTIDVAAGDTLYIRPGIFINVGSLTLESGSTAYIDGAPWSNSGTITVDSGASLYLQGTFTGSDLASITDDGGTIYIDGALDNSASTLSVGPGTAVSQVVLVGGGTITGGTIDDAGSETVFQGGTLDGVIYEGTLDLTPYNSTLTIVGGLTALASDGVSPGAINVGGNYSYVYFDDTQTFDNATITLSAYDDQIDQYTTPGLYYGNDYAIGTLTLGPNLIIDQTGSNDYLSANGYGGGNIVNDGVIDAEGGSFTINPTSFTNDGSIDVSGGDTLYIQSGPFINDGSITVESGSTAYIDGRPWSSTGTITVDSAAALYLQGSFTEADVATITDDGGSVYIVGAMDNTGSTLAVGPGTQLNQVVLAGGGTITGGTIDDAGSGTVFQGGTLDGVTYKGALDLTPYNSTLTIVGGLTALASDGVSPGAINVGGNYSYVYFDDTQTFDNATITLSAYDDQIDQYTTYGAWAADGYGTSPENLTFGPNLTIDETGGQDYITTNGYGGGNIVNDGTINASGGQLYIQPTTFTNTDTVDVSGGDTLYIQPGTFTNTGSVSVDGAAAIRVQGGVTGSGGTFDIATGGALNVAGSLTGQTIDFLDGTGQATIGDVADSTLTVSGFQAGDVIDLAGLGVASTAYSDGALALLDGGGNSLGAITVDGDYSGDTFYLAPDGSGGTDLTVRATPTAPASIPTTGLIGYWTGDGDAADSSSLANNGVFTGAYAPGLSGEAFNLATGGVTIPDNPAYADVGGNFSAGFWFNVNGQGNGSWDIIGQDVGPGSNPKWVIFYNYQAPDAFELHYNGASYAFLNSNPVTIPSGWNQFTVTDSGDDYEFYLNGTDIGSANFSGAFPAPGAPLQFGISDGGSPFPGLLENVVLYDRALSPAEVSELADAPSTASAPISIAAGAVVDLGGPIAAGQTVQFLGATGTLRLDDSIGFAGTVAGFTGADVLDLHDIAFVNADQATFSGGASGGTLTVSDGVNTASVLLMGQYMSSTFVSSSDGHGGTLVVDPVIAAANSTPTFIPTYHK